MLNLLSGRWTPHILWVLGRNGPTRFGALRRLLPGGVSAKALSESLRRLESKKVVDRHEEATVPPEVTYSLTERGRDLDRVLVSMNGVAERWGDGGGTGG